MPSKRPSIVVGEYYHVYNRGSDKRVIFNNEADLTRFLESIFIFNTVDPITSIVNKKKNLGLKHLKIGVQPLSEPLVSIVAYSILPNHFHFLIKQIREGGISEFMKRLQAGYTSYFNQEHSRSGCLLQGKFKYKNIQTDQYFKTLFCYVTFNSQIHNIPSEVFHLINSSFDEYQTKTPYLTSENEMNYVYKLFGSIEKIKSHGNEVVTIIKKQRLQKDHKINKDLFE